jgi:20S proteasome alpha/beta subunit
MPIESIALSVSELCLSFADKEKKKKDEEDKKRVSRPFGVSMIIAGIDRDGPRVYCTGLY